MTMMNEMTDRQTPVFTPLTGQFLIAMPGIDDERFEKTVIYITAHSEESGAMGIVINVPSTNLSFFDILDQLNLTHDGLHETPVVMLGGPDQVTRGFILHTSDYNTDMTIRVADNVCMTASQDILKDIIQGRGPKESLIALGCATWVPGQLEEEIMSNIWLTTPGADELLFKTPYAHRWEKALSLLGVDASLLSSQFGKA